MEKEDLRKNIIPQKLQNKENEFEDLIYIDSLEEQLNWKGNNADKITSATDYAIMNHVMSFEFLKTRLNKPATCIWIDNTENEAQTYILDFGGECKPTSANQNYIGICPKLHYRIPKSDEEKRNLNIKNIKDQYGNSLYHILEIGEYPKNKVNDNLEKKLEELYNNGILKEEIYSTGRWYSENGQDNLNQNYVGKHNPEFLYNNEKYVRVIPNVCNGKGKYSDKTIAENDKNAKWVKVEPISFIIKNWENLPKDINPTGTGKETYFDLKSEEAIIGNIPFYAENSNASWEKSMIRNFLNGNNTKDIIKCDFINEAFNRGKKSYQ